MKLQDSAFSSVKSANLPSSVVSYLRNASDEYEEFPVKGGLLRDVRYAWLASGSKFTVVNLKTSQKIAAWTFGVKYRDYNCKITSVCELPSQPASFGKQLLIGLECDIIGGMVCLFHCDGSRILRAIQTDCKVTYLTVLDDWPGGPLSCFDGAVLVGTQDGALLAFDLNRQSCFEAIAHATDGNEHLIRDELRIAKLAVLSLEDIAVIEEQRAIACNRDDHIAVQLNEGCFHGKQFRMYNPDNTVRLQINREKVFISHMLYAPQLVSLIIGFSYGAFQIWNLVTMDLVFTSNAISKEEEEMGVECLPITHMALQEPSDDPCAFCYLWVVHSAIDKYDDGFPVATMYALRYNGKKMINNAMTLYQDFMKCTMRFQMELTYPGSNIPVDQIIGGRCITCRTISKAVTHKSEDDSIINLCQIVWECWQLNSQAPVATYMILFDLDQWYKEHMPDSSNVHTNSYISFVNMSSCVTNNSKSHFCDVKIDVASLSQYLSVQKLEEHFYPNSYAYDCTCLISTESVWLSTLGVQRQLLSTLNSLGPSILLNPSRIYKQCIEVGLCPVYFDVNIGNASLSHQRSLVLSVALAGRLWRFLLRCARESPVSTPLSDDSLTATGTTQLPPIAEWAWNRAATIRSAAHSLATPLWVRPDILNNSAIVKSNRQKNPDQNSLRLLKECTTQLSSLDTLFGAIFENITDRVGPEVLYSISQRKNAVHMVSLYFRVVQWFVDFGLLPEYHLDEEEDLLDGNVQRLPYPIDKLIRSYQNRRLQLFRLRGDGLDMQDIQDKSCPLLFIDQLIDIECTGDKLRTIWKEDGSTTGGLYPPPSLHSLLKVYLQPDILEDTKHSLILYTLEDYAIIFGDRYTDAIRRLMQFPTMMAMSNADIKITQAFWHLDHKCFDFALEQLWGLCASDSSHDRYSWVQNAVVASLIAQRRAQAALQWLAGAGALEGQHLPNDEQMAVDIEESFETKLDSKWKSNSIGSLYLARRLPEAAMTLLRCSDPNIQDYIQFFNDCKRSRLLSKISKIPLTKKEEDIFVAYLRKCKDSQMNDILIMFYLQRARYAEAMSIKHSEKDTNFETWSLLVQMYCSGVPTLTTLTAAAPTLDISIPPIKVTEPVPLSVFVNPRTPRPITYKSSLIQSVIARASETWIDKPTVTRGLKRPLEAEETPFICTPKIRRIGRSNFEDISDASIAGDDFTPVKKSNELCNAAKSAKFEKSYRSEYSNATLEHDLEKMLESPVIERDVQSRMRSYTPDHMSLREATPQSILKVRKILDRTEMSPTDPRYYAETDEELETASQHTQQSDATRSIRFTIPDEDKSQSSTPPLLTDVSFTGDTDDDQYEIETSLNYNLPRKKFASDTNVQSSINKTKISPGKNSSDRSIFESASDDTCYSPNESIADVMAEIRPTAEKSSYVAVEIKDSEEKDTRNVLPQDMEIGDGDKSPISVSAKDNIELPKPRRSIRSRTPEIVETLPLRRSARRRSQTPEREPPISPTPVTPRAKTPTIKPTKSAKSLSRQVLEANTFIRRDTEDVSTPISKPILPNLNESILSSSLSESPLSTEAVDSPQRPTLAVTPIMRMHLPDLDESILSSDISPDKSPASTSVDPSPSDMRMQLFNESILSSDNSSIEMTTATDETAVFISEEIPIETEIFVNTVEGTISESASESFESYVDGEETSSNAETGTNGDKSLLSDVISVNSSSSDVKCTSDTNIPVNFTDIANCSILSEDASFVSDTADKLDATLTPTVESPIEVVVTNTEGVSTVEIVKANEPASVTEIKPAASSKTTSENNESIASVEDTDSLSSKSSLRKSKLSKVKSEDGESITSTDDADSVTSKNSLRKSRKSILPPKADLSVIPEDGCSKLDMTVPEDSIMDYSASRRLTRNQRSMLEKSLISSERKIETRRRAGASSAGSAPDAELSESIEATADPTQPVSPLDRSGTRQKRATLRKMRSASVDIPSPVRVTRRASSVDVDLPPSAPESPSGPPGRPRRQSFSKAIEALTTPRKGRRLSADSKPSEDSDKMNKSGRSTPSKVRAGSVDPLAAVLEPLPEDEDAPQTPRRRTRRSASEASSSVESKSPSRRSRAGSTSGQ